MRNIIAPLFSLYHYLWALGGAVCFWFPSRQLKVIGITGTKGKSTTVALLSWVLERAGHRVASLSSVASVVADTTMPNITGNTMPGRFFIQRFLRNAVRAGCEYAIVEVTSQGVVQHRHRFISWDMAVFLDIHPEHIESHGSFDKYLSAKVSFFSYVSRHDEKNPTFFINDEDGHADAFVSASAPHPTVLFRASDVSDTSPEMLGGEFNKINIAAAKAVAMHEGVGAVVIQQALSSFGGVAGRMQYVQKEPFAVVVDYAHTPDSLEAVYRSVKEGATRLHCVLGSAGGGRDTWKRPRFGELAGRFCDTITLTNEDPFDEEPARIVAQIQEGIPPERQKNTRVLLDRREAIEAAIEGAREGDVVVVTGKGSEAYIRVKKGKKIPWSDERVVKEALAKKEGQR